MSCFELLILLVCANLRSLTIIEYGLFMVCGVTITSLNIAEIFWAVVFLNTMNSGLVACSLRKLRPLIRLISMKIFSSTLHGDDIVCCVWQRLAKKRLIYGMTFFVFIVNSWNRLLVKVRSSACMEIFMRTCFLQEWVIIREIQLADTQFLRTYRYLISLFLILCRRDRNGLWLQSLNSHKCDSKEKINIKNYLTKGFKNFYIFFDWPIIDV
jgi:hypothetical protein